MLGLQVVTFLPALEDRPSTGFLMFDLILSTVHFLKIISVAVEMTLNWNVERPQTAQLVCLFSYDQ